MDDIITSRTQPFSQIALNNLDATVSGLPWEVGVSRSPDSAKKTVTFTSDDVGELRHSVSVVPVFDAGQNVLLGYTVEKSYTGAPEAMPVEEHIGSYDEALNVARNQMVRMTN